MALINCPECNQQISNKAAACPHCGNPLRPVAAQKVAVTTDPGQVVTTEATDKRYKATQFAGVMIVLLGIVSCTAAPNATSINAWIWFIGVTLYFGGRFGAWWHHG